MAFARGEMKKKEALEYLKKLGITNSELKEIYEEELKKLEEDYFTLEKIYSQHEESEFRKRKLLDLEKRKQWEKARLFTETVKTLANNLKDYGYEAVDNFYSDGNYLNKKYRGSETLESLMERHESSFKEDFYLSFVENTKYSISFDLKEEEYEAFAPKTPGTLIKEGYKMHNCLRARAYWAALGSMKFFFIRKKNDIETPMIDVILDKNNRIIWAITDNHHNVEGKTKDIVDEWYQICFGHKPNALDYLPRSKWFSI